VTKTSTLFLATTFENQTATLGRHSCPKTMGAFALDTAWLICAFHILKNSLVIVAGKLKKTLSETFPETRGWEPPKSAEDYAGDPILSIATMPVDNSE